MSPLIGGIEAGGTKFVCAVGTGPDDVRAETTFPTTQPEETLGRAIEFFRTAGAVEAVGVASFGPVDLRVGSPTYGSITNTPKPGWQDTDVVGPLHGALGVPVGFDTDVNGAALGEWTWGAGEGFDPIVYITVGTGIGGGALVHGRLLHGTNHPEMGHLPVPRHPDDDFPGRCPFHRGCLEGLACGPAIADRWGRPAHELGGDLAKAVEIEAFYLANAVVQLTLILAPHRIVMGGGVMKLSGLLEEIRRVTRGTMAGYVEIADELVVRPGLGDRAGVLGAIALGQRTLTQD